MACQLLPASSSFQLVTRGKQGRALRCWLSPSHRPEALVPVFLWQKAGLTGTLPSPCGHRQLGSLLHGGASFDRSWGREQVRHNIPRGSAAPGVPGPQTLVHVWGRTFPQSH